MVIKSKFLDEHYRKYSERLLHYIAGYLDQPSMAQDLMQEVFLRAQNTANWETMEKPQAFLFAVARNLINDYYRKQKITQQENTCELNEELHSLHLSSESKRLEARDHLRKLLITIQSLPPRASQAFMLNRVYRFSYAEVGRMMNISPRTVENHVAYGLKVCIAFMQNLEKKDPLLASNITDINVHRNKRP